MMDGLALMWPTLDSSEMMALMSLEGEFSFSLLLVCDIEVGVTPIDLQRSVKYRVIKHFSQERL